MAALLASCQGEQKQARSYVEKREAMLAESRNPKVERMRDYNYTGKLEWASADSYSITLRAVDSLGTIVDDDGTQYVNNRLCLSLSSNGHAVFSRTFTKGDFALSGNSRFIRRALLQGMAFDRITAEGARFIASVGLPFSDEFVQYAVIVSPSGSCDIQPTEDIDGLPPADSIKEN